VVDGHVGLMCYAGCSRKAICEAIGITESDLYPKERRKGLAAKKGLSILDLQQDKKIFHIFLSEWGVTDAVTYTNPETGKQTHNLVRIPYFNLDGSEHTKGRMRKALRAKDGSWFYGDGDVIPYGLNRIDSKTPYLVIVEGESDTWTGWQWKIPTLGIPGAQMTKCLMPEHVSSFPKKVYILQEPDPAGISFPSRVAARLQECGYTGTAYAFSVSDSHAVKDLNDLQKELFAKGKANTFAEELQLSLDAAKELDMRTEHEKSYDILKKRVTDAVEEKNLEALYALAPIIAELEPAEQLYLDSRMSSVKGFSKRGFNNLKKDALQEKNAEKREKIPLNELADALVEKHRHELIFNIESGTWFSYTGTHWNSVQEKEASSSKTSCTSLDRLVRELLVKDLGLPVTRVGDFDSILRLAAIDLRSSFPIIEGKVNFANGTLDVESGVLSPHNREDLFTYCLPYSYDPGTPYNTIERFLDHLFGGDTYVKNAYKAQIGLALLGDVSLHFAVAIVGDPRTGKSLALNLANLVCGIPVGQYVGATLFNNDMEGKRVRFAHRLKQIACIDELPKAALRNEDVFKNITAHSGVDMRGICQDDELQNRWKSKVVMAMNEYPEYKDTSGAIGERIIILPVKAQKLARQDRNRLLIKQFESELGGFVQACIQQANAVLDIGYMPMSSNMKSKVGDLATEHNALKAFLKEHYCQDPNGVAFIDPLFEGYGRFCDLNRHKASSKSSMVADLMGMGLGLEKKKQRDPLRNNLPYRGLKGIRLRTPEEKVEEGTLFVETYTDDPVATSPKSVATVANFSDAGYTIGYKENGSTSQPTASCSHVANKDSVNTCRENNIHLDDKNNISLYVNMDGKNGYMATEGEKEGLSPSVEPSRSVAEPVATTNTTGYSGYNLATTIGYREKQDLYKQSVALIEDRPSDAIFNLNGIDYTGEDCVEAVRELLRANDVHPVQDFIKDHS
jgi:P4 family phage/plasmid primase-like protien